MMALPPDVAASLPCIAASPAAAKERQAVRDRTTAAGVIHCNASLRRSSPRPLEHDRSALINDALDAYLELHHWQVEHIEPALAEADSGAAGVPHDEVFNRLRARITDRLKLSD
jgi:predicted transcriptional regulator